MNKIRVMIVEDSRATRRLLEYVIGTDARLEVVSSVESGEEALHHLSRVAPDVVSMDIHLPGINGYEATRRIMEERPTPIVVVSSCVHSRELDASMRALKAGALAVVEKPVGALHRDYDVLADRLRTQLAIMSQVNVVRQRFNRKNADKPAPKLPNFGRGSALSSCDRAPLQMVGIVASTGGPKALQTILGGLAPEFPLPIALVQHITPSFHDGFVRWLDQVCRLSVVTAEDGQFAEPGRVYVAPPDRHLHVDGLRLRLRNGECVASQKPSGTVLLDSIAGSLGPRALGIVLTGMGDDGAVGLHALRRAGGYTIAEDASTAVVYGMPAAAAGLGAVCEQLPLDEIGPRLTRLVRDFAETTP
jgi:two-component system chemotaxis response regulator CheB